MRPTNSVNSKPVKWSNSSDSSGTRPILAFTSRACSGMDRPSSSMLPEVGGARPISMRMVVVLPAPFGPKKPKKLPRGTSRSSPSTAAFVPYTLRRLPIEIARKHGPVPWYRMGATSYFFPIPPIRNCDRLCGPIPCEGTGTPRPGPTSTVFSDPQPADCQPGAGRRLLRQNLRSD